MVLLCLIGIFVDGARIMTADRKVQGALNSAARSALAGYDENLSGGFGLFAFDNSDGNMNDVFLKYLNANLKGYGDYNLVNYEINDAQTGVEGHGSLMDDARFKDQIVGYMKYKAPVMITRNIIEKFSASGLSGKLSFARSEEKVRGRRKNIRKDIEGANKNVNDLNTAATRINSDNSKKNLQELEKYRVKLLGTNAAVHTAGEGLLPYREIKKLSDVNAEAAGIEPTRTEFGSAEKSIETIRSKIAGINSLIDGFLDSVRPLTDGIRECEGLKTELRVNNMILNNQIAAAARSGGESEIESLRKEIDSNNRAMQQLDQQIREKNRELDLLRSGFRLDLIEEIASDEAGNDPEDAPVEPGTVKSIVGIINDIKTKLGEYTAGMDASWLISKEDFEQEKTLEDSSNMEMIKAVQDMKVTKEIDDEDEAENKNTGILDFMGKLLNEFGKLAYDGLEKVYMEEFIMDKYTYLISRTERDHFFNKGEVEYILWGDNSELANIGKTIGFIAFLRLCINTLDGFAKSKNPHPVFRLIYAVGKGVIRTWTDVSDLCRGKEINIVPDINNVKLNYSDHLRVLLLLQPEKKLLNNMRQLIQANLKKDDEHLAFKNYRTVLHARAEVRINLWFTHLIRIDRFGKGNFIGNRYIIRKEIYTGY